MFKHRTFSSTKISYTNEYEIDNQEKLIAKIAKMAVCPVCNSKINKDHEREIKKDT